MQTLIHAQDLIEANLIKNLLAQESIEATILGEYLQGAIGELPPSGLIRVVVADSQLEPAQQLLADYFDSDGN